MEFPVDNREVFSLSVPEYLTLIFIKIFNKCFCNDPLFVVLGSTFLCVRSDVSILRLQFHKVFFPVTVRSVKGNWDPNSAVILVEADSNGIPSLFAETGLHSGIPDHD